MSENKVNIYTILDPNFVDCHDVIMKSLQDDLYTLYSCIRVNRFFCQNFVPILWRNPFKFIKNDEKLIEIFNTLVHCLDQTDKEHLINRELINIIDLPTPNTYFKYHTYIREFELNPLQIGLRLWISKYFRTDNSHNSQSSNRKNRNRKNRKRIDKKVIKLNNYIGNLLFNEENRYESLNIFHTDLLSGQRNFFDICEIENHEESLIKVNKLSLGVCHRYNTGLIPHIRKNFLKLQNALSPNIQHLQICIETTEQHTELSEELITLIQCQRNLKSLSINPFWKHDDEIFNPFLVGLQKQSKSLTFLKLQDFRIYTTKVLSILKSLPNLITLDFELFGSIIDVSQEISALSASHFKNLKHLCYKSNIQDNFLLYIQLRSFHNSQLHYFHHIASDQICTRILLFKKILSSSINLKSLKVSVDYCPSIKQVQRQFALNLTHFHLVLTNYYIFDDLVTILKNFNQLVHLKLTSSTTLNGHFIYLLDHERISYGYLNNQYQNYVLGPDNLFRKFSKALAQSLKILEVNFPIADEHLEILFNEPHLNIQCVKLYYCEYYSDSSLRVFIDYARRKGCFKELGIPRDTISQFSKQYVEEAKNHFNITFDNNIDNPFYDVPINSRFSWWSK